MTLFDEFKHFYDRRRGRCPHAPVSAWRVYAFAKSTVFNRVSKQITLAEFLSLLLTTLLDSREDGEAGLLVEFNPGLYNGPLPLTEHWMNMLRSRLWSSVRNYVKWQQRRPSIQLKPPTILVPVSGVMVRVKMDPPRRGRSTWYAHWKGTSRCTGHVDLHKAVEAVKRMLGVPDAKVDLPKPCTTPQAVKEALYRWRRGNGRKLALVGAGEPIHAEKDLKLALHVAVSRLPDDQRQIVQSVYWDNRSLRETAKLLGIYHTRAVRLHADALRRLEGSLAA